MTQTLNNPLHLTSVPPGPERQPVMILSNLTPREPTAPTPLLARELQTKQYTYIPRTNIPVWVRRGMYYPRSINTFEKRRRDGDPEWLVELARISLMGLHAMRCEQNELALEAHKRHVAQHGMTEDDEQLVWKAKVGEARMGDILELLAHPLGFTALEGSKLSPYGLEDGEALLQGMSADNSEVIQARDETAEVSVQNPNKRIAIYRVSRTEDGEDVNGLLVAMKEDIAHLKRDNIRVVERKSAILDFNRLREHGHLPRLLHKAGRILLSRDGSEDRAGAILAQAGPLLVDAFTRKPEWVTHTTSSVYGVRTDLQGIGSRANKKAFFPIQIAA